MKSRLWLALGLVLGMAIGLPVVRAQVVNPGLTFARLATPPPNTALGSSVAPFGSLVAGGGGSFDPYDGSTPFDLTNTSVGLNGLVTALLTGPPFTGVFSNWTLDPSVDAIASFRSVVSAIETAGGNTQAFGFIYGHESDAVHNGTGTVQYLAGNNSDAENASTGHVDSLYAYAAIALNNTSGTVDKAYGFAVDPTYGIGGTGTTTAYAFYAPDLAARATNIYYSWFDSRGVRRVKEDATFDSVGQAIETLYNPQFAKYTPGATDYERIVLGQWHGNVAEIGTEKGGTGTLRAVKIIGASLDTPATLTANGVAVATQTYVNAQGFVTASSATAFTNKSGNISQWTNDSDYLTTVGSSSGTGNLVRVTSATLVTPTLGAALATSINGNTFTTGTYTLTGAAGKTLTFSNSLTLAGTDATTLTFPSTSATMARTDAGQTFTGVQAFTAPTIATGLVITEAVGTSALVVTGAIQTTSFPALNITQTWNGSGIPFTAIKLNVTNTLSASVSYLMDLEVGSSPHFLIQRDGTTQITSAGFEISTTGVAGAATRAIVASNALYLKSTATLTFSSSSTDVVPIDLTLGRAAAATLQMGVDVNGPAVAQTFQSCRGITGSDKTGAPFHFVAGPGTGAATVSYIDFTTPTVTTTGTTQQTGVVRATISSASLNATVPIAFGGNLAISNAVPTISSGFGSGATIAGIAGGFRITCGTAPGVGGTVAFNATYANAPVCFVQDETTGILGIAAPTTTTVVISGLTLLAGQTVAVFVFGY